MTQIANLYFSAVRNPAWGNAEHTQITCEVNFNHVNFEEWTPFCACPNDHMPYSKIIFDECAAGVHGTVAEYVSPFAPLEVEAPVEGPVEGVQTL